MVKWFKNTDWGRETPSWDNNILQFFPLYFCVYSFQLLLECYSYGYLNDSVRGQGFYNGYNGYYQCDSGLPFGWYRFSGVAGSQMTTSCVGKNRCSSHAPGWLSTQHPSKDDGIVRGTVCFHWASSCCHWSTNIRVRNCSGFYVYELRPVPSCWLRYCGNGGGMWHLASLSLFDTIIYSWFSHSIPYTSQEPHLYPPTHPPPPIPHL